MSLGDFLGFNIVCFTSFLFYTLDVLLYFYYEFIIIIHDLKKFIMRNLFEYFNDSLM